MIDRRSLLLAGAGLCLGPAAQAQSLPWQPVRRRAPEARLESHRREALYWRRDIVQGPRISLLGLSFVGCQVQCPAIETLFKILDDQAPASIDLYTMTLAPLENDWRALAGHAEQLGSSERWRWLTGEHSQVFAVLDALDASYSNLEKHSQPILLLGRGRYDRIDQIATADQLIAAAR